MFSIDTQSKEQLSVVAVFTTDGSCGTLAAETMDQFVSNWAVLADMMGKTMRGVESYIEPLTPERFEEFVATLRSAVFVDG